MAEERDPLIVPFTEAEEYFRQKISLPTKDWLDLQGRSHDRAFVVAGAMQTALIEDLRAEVQKAIEGRTTLADFRAAFDEIVARHGWTGWAGEGSARGRAWRTKVIFETNLRTAYAAGRYAQMTHPDTVKVWKWWRYEHAHTREPEQPRRSHRAWDGTVLAWNDPWWGTHYPPNGWNCSCGVEVLSDRDLTDEGITPGPAPETLPRRVIDPKTGETVMVPQGIDFGWDHAPGRDWSRGLVPREFQQPLAPWAGERDARATTPLPGARPFKAGLIDADQTVAEAANAFLSVFGGDINTPVMVRDAAGHALPLSADMFREHDGEWKALKRGRGPWMARLAEAILDPDEIWVEWQKGRSGAPILVRNYIRRGPDGDGFVVFWWSGDGWTADTAFTPDKPNYLENQRRGALLYQRP